MHALYGVRHINTARTISGKGLIAVSVWGASFVVTRVALRSFSPFGLVSARLMAGTLVLYLILRMRGLRLFPRRADWGVCALLGFTLAAHLVIQGYGLEYTSAMNTAWIIGLIPITLAVGSQVLGLQRLGRFGALGLFIGAVGVCLVTAVRPPDFARARFGDLLQVSSCLTWTVYTLAGAGPVARNGALRVTAFAMGIAAIIVSLCCSMADVLQEPITPESFLAAVFLGVVCSGVAYWLWFQAVIEHGPARVGALIYLEPLITLVVARIVLREPVMLNALAGGVLTLSGVYLVTRGSVRFAPSATQPGTAPKNTHRDRESRRPCATHDGAA